MSVMIVTGAFATHTTKLYNYYVCPDSWNVAGLTHIGVNYFKELKYLGKIEHGPFNWSFNEALQSIQYGANSNNIPAEIRNDLEKFKTLLNGGDHYLFLLSPIIGGCVHANLPYHREGAFTISHRYFPSIGDMLASHQGITAAPNLGVDTEGNATFKNDSENQ